MKLLKLSSENPKFRTLEFNSGLNIVAGLQLSEEDKKSINGIGKSLSLTLVHYLLGAGFDEKNPQDKKLKAHLQKYGLFALEFEHNKQRYVIEKDFAKTDFYINKSKVTQSNYGKELDALFFKNQYSFRQVFNCFARRYGKTYYSNVLAQQGLAINDYRQRLTNLFLLGIDTLLITQRVELKTKLTNLRKSESIVKDYEKNIDKTNLKDIADEIEQLKNKKANFIIAESFDALKKQADDLTIEVNDLRNKLFFMKKLLQKKESNLALENINVDVEQIKEIYEEAKFFFDEKITKRLADAQNFHNTLISNRKKILLLEIKELKVDIEQSLAVLKTKEIQRDTILKDLDNAGALEEFNSITERIKSLEIERDKLKQYENLLHEFKKEKSILTIKSANIQQESILYLEEKQEFLDTIENKFRELVKHFYDNHGGFLKIKETKDAQYLFDIFVDIPKDGSQGIGNVKVFCYDVLLYLLNKDLLGFMAHDGCIFSGMDYRQQATLFKIIIELVNNNDFQYFLNVGENILEDIYQSTILNEGEKQLITDSKILNLNDKSPENWLLGESFD